MRDGQRVALNTLVMVVKQVCLAVLSVAFVGYMARTLGVADWGEFQASIAVVMVVTVVAGIGVRGYLAREVAVQPELGPAHLGSALLIRGISGSALLALTVVVALLSRSVGGLLITIAAASQLATLLYNTMWLSFEAHERFQYILYAELAARLFVIAVAGGLLWMGAGVIAAALAFMAGNILELLLTYYFVRTRLYAPRFDLDWRQLYAIAKAALPIGILGAIATVLQQMDRVMLRVLSGDSAVGVYSAAWVLTDNFNLLSDLFLGASFAAGMRLYASDRAAFGRLYDNCMMVALMLALPIAGGLYILAPDVIHLIYGARSFEQSSSVLRVLVCQLPLTFAYQVGTLPLLAQKRERSLAKLLGLSVCVNAALNLALIPRFQALGAAIATLLAATVTLFGSYRLTAEWARQVRLRRVVAIAGATLTMSLGAYTARLYFGMWASIGVGIVVYVGALLLSRALSPKELAALLRRETIAP